MAEKNLDKMIVGELIAELSRVEKMQSSRTLSYDDMQKLENYESQIHEALDRKGYMPQHSEISSL